jgi:transposase
MDATPRAPIALPSTEFISTSSAAKIVGRSQRTIRRWCTQFDIGHKALTGDWYVSRPALNMVQTGDREALTEWRKGARAQQVLWHFCAVGLAHLVGADQVSR